jgi:CRISPR-associated endonuclease/helicase Cas3
MNYKLGNFGDLYDLVSDNRKGRWASKSRFHHGMKRPQFIQALQTAGEKFFVIEKNTTSVLVPYKEGCTLLEKYRHAKLSEKTAILRKMGRYCVQLYRYQAEGLIQAGALLHMEDDLLILDSDFYDLERGVDFKKEMKLLYVN